MKKKFALAVCAAFTAVTLVACSGGRAVGEGQSVEGTQEDAKPVAAPAAQSKGSIAVEDLEAVVTEDVDGVIAALTADYEALAADIDSYEKYVGNVEKVEAFYDKVLKETEELGIRLRQYSANCANAVFASDRTNGQKYDDFEAVHDVVYEDAGDDVHDEIYDGILKDAYDLLYDGILKDAKDSVGYGEWSEVRSNEYEILFDIRSDVYESIFDCRSEIYSFYSDVRSELYSDDLERAQKKTDDFQEDIDKLRG